jgi:SGNH domain (fused to AT3 domains)
VQWNDQVLDWLADHLEVQTALSPRTRARRSATRGGRGMFATARAGYREEIRRLLRLVRRVVVIRDVPTAEGRHLRCVGAALKETHERRRRAHTAAAARGLSARVKIIDLTDRFCDDRRCFGHRRRARAPRQDAHDDRVLGQMIRHLVAACVGRAPQRARLVRP